MPSAGKRRGRQTTDGQPAADLPDSSPSRPQKRKRASNQKQDAPSAEPTVKNQPKSQLGDAERVEEAVIAILDMPPRFVQVSRDHSNDSLASSAGIKAFAKIAGKDWTFYVKKLATSIGRAAEAVYPTAANASESEERSIPAAEASRDPSAFPIEGAIPGKVDIDLGPHKLVSRQHAEIYFDAESETWFILVNGRNPIKVNETLVRRGEKMKLHCGHVIEIGQVQMLFILPGETLRVHNKWIHRAGLNQSEFEQIHGDQNPVLEGRANSAGGPSYATPILPAPPDYRRAGTPVRRGIGSYNGTPRGSSFSNMMVTTDQLDLSLDQNQHIKPSYSYAQLITQAILGSEGESATLATIYDYIMKHFSFYRKDPVQSGWQNSIRHNLSLTKAFSKVPRSFDEPGKGMKWVILSDYREEYRQNARRSGRGGQRGPSAPGSPAVSSQVTGEPAAGDTPGPTKRVKGQSRSGSPTLSSYPLNVQHTPNQQSSAPSSGYDHDALLGDGSPLPRHRRQNSTYGLSDNVQGSPPTLSSSYLPEEGASFITPAPVRVHPLLQPPSTAQRPSQHMPTSSPAPFWKYAEFEQTPMRTPFGNAAVGPDVSPTKGSGAPPLQSSSPPASRVAETGSPTRNQNPSALSIKRDMVEVDDEEEGGIDLTRGFQSISTFHSQANSGVPVNGRI